MNLNIRRWLKYGRVDAVSLIHTQSAVKASAPAIFLPNCLKLNVIAVKSKKQLAIASGSAAEEVATITKMCQLLVPVNASKYIHVRSEFTDHVTMQGSGFPLTQVIITQTE